MLADFWFNLKLGLFHVLDWNAYDHILFLIALVAAYTFSEGKRVFWLVTVFTLGHTVSLTLSAYEVIQMDSGLIEFLIPVSILFTAIYNIIFANKNIAKQKVNGLYALTLIFGLIHGFGFSSYFNLVSQGTENKLVMLVEFALGVELAQLFVVVPVLILGFLVQNLFRFSKKDWILISCSIVIGLCIPILREIWIW
ncbi:HupE/UreJ family protein [Mesohalobacter halotolerans]|uniref:HupE/UreJ family protein n=1 Tax=Mesohalobacter halotolerans TaxID=1883405 RepID=A0A4U5TTI0_9FLAO|nr:HupE/UreJ family protein [Mesohalobacter halotolerans]MBS3739061.1 HupE/UreJ family protein [Psychroflexus sp.]TKS57443.1 HupE/UreJ family protein [Mesohalobacter halotolerans]